MLGMVRRQSISSLEQLELERPCSKISKEDSLSIYETTLLKLKEGSHRVSSLPSADLSSVAASCCDSPKEGTMAIDSSWSSAASLASPSSCLSTEESLKEDGKRNVSVLDMFSRYWSMHCKPSAPDETMVVESSSGTSQ